MNFTKEQFIEIRKLLKLFYDRFPRKRMTSLVTAGTLNVSCLFFSVYCFLFEDYELSVIVKSLVASGVSLGLLITMIVLYIDSYVEDKDDINRIRTRKK